MAIQLLSAEDAVHSNPVWHELRRQGVTASEIPVILGLSRWDSPWALWHRKRGLIDDTDAGESAAWGRRLEPVIADAWAERHPDLVLERAGLYCHQERDWQMATPDRLVYESVNVSTIDAPGAVMPGSPVGLLEVKHPYSFNGWGEDGTDEIPAEYLAQCLWQLDVMDLDICWLAAYTSHQLRVYEIHREGNEDDLELMRKMAYEFLTREEPPPLDSHPATLAAVKALHPDIEDRDQQVPARTAAFYQAAKRELDAAKARMREAEAELRVALGNARRAVTADLGVVATRSVYERRSLDGARLRRDHPDLADKYTTTTIVDRLTPARKDTHDGEDQ